ncbi:MAG: hypothetical protein KJN92_03840, partial [Gemmatimonadetes bacterium]|nr:hypothetical protein [Gemmatimonadota bacterium]
MAKKRSILSRLAPVLALTADLFTQGGSVLDRTPSQISLEAAMAAQAQVTQDWMDRPGVVGTAVGRGSGGKAVVKVYVTALGTAALPQSVAGIPVDVELTGPFLSYADPPSRTKLAAEDNDIDPKASFPRPVPIG